MGILKYFLFPIHKEGVQYIVIAAAVSLLISLFFGGFLIFGLLLTLAVALFFRNPVRVTPRGADYIVSPADGIVTYVGPAQLPKEIENPTGEYTRISIFLSVLDVHVNRVPAGGTIKQLHYNPGKFLSATLEKASDDNERQTVLMESLSGKPIAFVQIAGLIARRIICDLKMGDSVEAGERFGIIRFGSRMDVYFPEGVAPQVIVGQRMIGGETILANLAETGLGREGTVH